MKGATRYANAANVRRVAFVRRRWPFRVPNSHAILVSFADRLIA